MERVIDRKEYRRNATAENWEEEQVDVWQKRIRKWLWQSLGASLLVLLISGLKFCHQEQAIQQIRTWLNEPITVTSLQEKGQKMYQTVCQYYGSLQGVVETLVSPEGNAFLWAMPTNSSESGEEGESGEQLASGETLESGEQPRSGEMQASGEQQQGQEEPIYESAVEGINQMSEDSKVIQEQYQLAVPVIGTITSEFGVRNSTNPQVSHYHSGLDIAANTGTQILAAEKGNVVEAGTDTYYGKYLKVQQGDLIMLYAHCSKLLKKAGDSVKKGELIAYVGSTGNATGSHLHFELRYQNRLVDPKGILGL